MLLVGSDARPGDTSFNTDTMIVVSVEPSTSEVAMFQVPRDMADVPVPANARSVWGSVYRGKINSWFTQNRNRTDLWPGKTQNARGFAALKALLGELYGLDIRNYVLVNFDGFKKVVNALGGVNINVQIPVAESQYPQPGGALTRIYIPAGPQHMTGGDALIYARSRHRAVGGDFDRGRRQQRVLLSLREQMNAQAIIANLPALVSALKDSVKTDITTKDLPKLLVARRERRHEEHPLVRVLAVLLRDRVPEQRPRLHHHAERGPHPQGRGPGVHDHPVGPRPPRAARGGGRDPVGPQRLRPLRARDQHGRRSSSTRGSPPRRRAARPASGRPRRRSSSTTAPRPISRTRSSTSRTGSRRP